ncbi:MULTISPECIES: hypothetical protein [Psychrobacillus]|uniref:Uncharacterized protein n=1 Tax=Psychrobacillus faecigallinarum TaxID=2762235 RepID=A0ABR8R8R3_9BACI|nr:MULTISPECIES: hypothetical protein [Psychrobacillus]MBD7944177.1 hypothetical protein [Psychrobacillus faecigallinarum]
MTDKKKKKENTLDREEYGYGYDISPKDLGVVGQNEAAKRKNNGKQQEYASPKLK